MAVHDSVGTATVHPLIDSAPWRSIPAMFKQAVERHGGRAAVIDEGRVLTYRELGEEVDLLARALVAVGIGKGDRIAIWLPNGWKWIACTLALQQVGAVLVPLNTRFKAAELGFILHKVEPRLIFYQAEFLGVDYARELARAEHPPLLRVDVEGESGDYSWGAFREQGAGIRVSDIADRLAAVGPCDLSDIMFTSGTTGEPKGVLSLHGQVTRAFHNFGRRVRVESDDVFGLVIPFFHSFGYKAGWVMALMWGATVVPIRRLEPVPLLRLIEERRITYLPGPPTLYYSLIHEPRRGEFDISSLRYCVVGTTNVPTTLIREMREELGFEAILQGYGITEATAQGATSLWGDSDELVSTTAGVPHEELEAKIVDEEGADLPAGQIGEVWLRGFYVTPGYYADAQATRDTITADGWLKTGDLGSLDTNGYLTLHGRKREMIIVGGFNAYPAEIENLLAKHPKVGEVAVVGIADARLGEVPAAFVVPQAGQLLDEAELITWAKDNLANFKVPRRVVIMDQLPRNASGKVVKGDLPPIPGP